MKEKLEGMLSPYRVLDLTDEKGLLCGKLLGDLGADVIKIERPGGDLARSIGPFYHDEADPEKSLFWFAFNTSKRGITLDIETADGQELFKRLVKTADFVIESFPVGYLDKLGLGYSALEKVNPGIIMVSITPFGQTGPYKDYKEPDIVAWAMNGYMYGAGDADRRPVRISHHSQAYLHAATDAAVGAMMALYHRQATGEGQQVDVSIQAALAQYHSVSRWDMQKLNRKRGGGDDASGREPRLRSRWLCKDGEVFFTLSSGRMSPQNNPPLVEWMDSKGMADDYLKGFDWSYFGYRKSTQEVVDRVEERAAKFLLTQTMLELLDGGVKRHLMFYPVATVAEIMENTQLASRGFWVEVEHPELGTSITYPGAFARCSEVSPRVSRRAPLIGEHNQEIYEQELGLSTEKLVTLKQARVI